MLVYQEKQPNMDHDNAKETYSNLKMTCQYCQFFFFVTHSSSASPTSPSPPPPLVPRPPSPMANFPVNVIPYLPHGMTIELGPKDCVVRDEMVGSPTPPLRHDFLAMVEVNCFGPFHQKGALHHTIEGLLHESQFFPSEVADHPLGVGVFGFASSLVRDAVVGTTFELDENEVAEHTIISFVPHDAALNMRLTSFGPEVWILFVGFPYDYQTQHYMHKSVDSFGALVDWHNPRGDRIFVLIKARVIHLRLVPKILVVL